MKKIETVYYIGQCPICREYGQLEIDKDILSGNYLVMCDECLAKWENPEKALNNVNGYRASVVNQDIRKATFEEIVSIGWEKFILTT